MTATRPRDAPTDLEREAAAVDFLLRHVGLDPERCRTEGGAINLGRVRSMLEDCAPQPETWSLYVAGMIGTYLKWPVGDSRVDAIAGIIARRRKFDAAPPAAQPLTDADIEAVMGPCEGSAFAEHLRREFVKSFKRVYFKLHPERAHGIGQPPEARFGYMDGDEAERCR